MLILPGVFNFNDISSSLEKYLSCEEYLKNILEEDFLKRKELVILQLDSVRHEMTLGKLFINLLLMRPFIELGVGLCEDDIFDGTTITQDTLDDYFNHVIKRLRCKNVNADYDEIRRVLIAAMNEMCDLSGRYNVKVGNSVSYLDLIKLENTDPEFEKLTHTKIQPGQYHDIEMQFKDLGKKLIKYFKAHPETELHPFVASETGINTKQFTQAIGFIGLKPSMTGDVIPVAVNDNFLRGLSSLESYYINASGTKKALEKVPLALI